MLAPDSMIRERYLIRHRIGAGTSAIYQAFDVDNKAQVILKQIADLAGADTTLHAEFERTARLLAGMHHTSLPQVIDHFVEGDSALLVMGFLPGDDLATMFERNGKPFAVDQVLGWAAQLLDVLEYLHSRKPPVIHGDVKPQNIKLTPSGTVMLLDAGLPKGSPLAVQRQRAISVRPTSSPFLPPELLAGDVVDQRGDLFAAAATLYYLLTGVPPVPADRRAMIVSRSQPDPLLAPSAINRQIPDALGTVLLGALALEPERRPASIADFRAALAGALHAPASAAAVAAVPEATKPTPDEADAVPSQPSRRWTAWMFAGVIVLMLVVFLLLGRGGRGNPTPTPTPQQIANAIIPMAAVPPTPTSTPIPTPMPSATATVLESRSTEAPPTTAAFDKQTATAQASQIEAALSGQTATTEILAATSAAEIAAYGHIAQPPAPTKTRVPPSPTRTPSLFMAVQRTNSSKDLKCINVHMIFEGGYNGNGWTLVAEGLGITVPFNTGGYAALCVSKERQEFRFSILPPAGLRATGNRSVPARGSDNFEAYTRIVR